MKRNLQLQLLLAVLSAGLMFSSCGNIDIVKRKYRPGFHVEVSKKQRKSQPVDESVAADTRKVENTTPVEVKQPEITVATVAEDLTVSTQVQPSAPLTSFAETNRNLKKQVRSTEFKEMNFQDRMKSIEREVFKPKPVANVEWMKWVSFGTGIGSLAFGALALTFAILTVVFFSGFVWGAAVLAILLGAAAITFSLIYKRNNGSDSKSRLGFIFGIIGAGLGFLAIVLGAIFFAVFVL